MKKRQYFSIATIGTICLISIVGWIAFLIGHRAGVIETNPSTITITVCLSTIMVYTGWILLMHAIEEMR